MQNIGSKIFLALTGVAFIVAIYHSYDELTESFLSCNLTSRISCGGVFESGYTSLFGVPFYVLGLVWFPLVLVVASATSKFGRGQLNLVVLLPLLMIGNLFTIYLWYLELGVIGIICPVCITLYLLNYALTGVLVKVSM